MLTASSYVAVWSAQLGLDRCRLRLQCLLSIFEYSLPDLGFSHSLAVAG